MYKVIWPSAYAMAARGAAQEGASTSNANADSASTALAAAAEEFWLAQDEWYPSER